MLTIVMDVTH